MGLDGFSMANLGLHRDLTSAQLSNQAEILATKGLEFKVQDVGELVSEQGIERREEGSGGGGTAFDKKKKEQEDLKDQEEELKARALIKEKEIENQNPKEISVRINPSSDQIELFNNKDNRVIETISANDLMVLISKLDSASGILVNRKI